MKQHLIDPEICIRCYTCEEMCPADAITHDHLNVVIDADKCNYCMNCIAPCPTGSIDVWHQVDQPYSLEEQYDWDELPEEQAAAADDSLEALDDDINNLLAQAHAGTAGKPIAPASAAKAVINQYTSLAPAKAVVQGSYRLTDEGEEEVRHIIISFQDQPFQYLEGQNIGIIAPGTDADGKPHQARLYSVSSPRDGERPNTNNLSLTVKRDGNGVCSNYLCDLKKGDTVDVVGPYGSTFLMPEDPQARIMMICTGTGSAPFRAFTMRRQRTQPSTENKMILYFGARRPESLPYFGPLGKVPDIHLNKHFAFSRLPDQPKQYVQDKMLANKEDIGEQLKDPNLYVYICGLNGMESGVNEAFEAICRQANINWAELKQHMREQGRYHVETY
jgi:benzoyl-CoA 2,3-dioxygenase component A